MNTVRVAFIVFVSVLGLAFSTSGAQAANRFLVSPIPIDANPVINQTNGDFDFAEADNGDAVALWGQADGLYGSIRPGDGTFGPPIEVADFFNAGTSLPEVAIAPNGYAVMVWRQDVDGESQVMAAARNAGASTFTSPVQVSTEPFQIPNVDPQVDVADNGTALIAWIGRDINGDANSSRIRKRFLNPGGTPGLPPTNASPSQGVGFPDVAVGPNGHSLTTWIVGDSITGDPATLWMQPDGDDADYQLFDTNNGSWMTAAVDAVGNAVIADRIGSDVIGNHRPAGPGQDFLFDQSLRIPGTQAGRPEISMDADGRATVAFSYFQGGQDGIQTVDREAGGDTLFGTTTKAVPESADVIQVEIEVGGDGTAILGWVREDDRVYSAVRDAGAPQFGVPTGPISPPVEFGNVRVGAAGDGKAIVAFSSANPAEDFSLNALPYDDTPTASDLVIPEEPVQGVEASFSVSPVDPWAAVTGIEWEVDQGVTLQVPQVKHTYMTPGDQMVGLTLTDALGNETTTGRMVQVQPDVTPPKLTKVSMLKKKSKRGKKNAFRFTLSDRARIVIKVKRTSKGKGKKAQGKIVRKSVAAGKRKVVFKGRIGKRKLKPAKYQAKIVAVDQFGNRSKPRKLRFRIIR